MTLLIAPKPASAKVVLDSAPPPIQAGTANPKAGFYRHDLDGLRGVAILMVAAFHIWFGRVSGGVDVFLALSGFFFGGKLLRNALGPRPSLSPHRELVRLARRLLPALVVVLAGCAVLTILIQPQTRWETFADQSLASLGYYQNWELAWTASNYLRAGEAVSPLQHIWSMSVQGQFYVAFLVLIFGFTALLRRPLGPRLRVFFVVLLSVLTITSFVYAIFAHQADQSAAYYNSFARAWELLLGTLAGAVVGYVRWPMWLRTLAATLALATILSCGWLIDGVMQFPGPWALVPVGATLLMILAAANRQADAHTAGRLPLPNRVLATAPLVRLGSMAYALYLWHWPLLIFWLSMTGHTHASIAEGTGILAVSVVLAYLTLRFVEEPLRDRRSSSNAARSKTDSVRAVRFSAPLLPRLALGSVIAVLAVAVTATSFSWREHVILQRASGNDLAVLSPRDYPGAAALLANARVPDLQMRPTVLEASKDLPQTTTDSCISDFKNGDVINCTYGDRTAKRTIALAGGSHAEHWITALDTLGLQHHFKVVTYLKMGCALSTETAPLIMGNNAPYPQCFTWVNKTMAKLVADRPDYVFTTSTRPWNIKPGDVMPGTYIGIWQTFADHNIPVLAMRDTPWLVEDGKPFIPADCLASGGNATSCGQKRSDLLADQNPTLEFVAQFPGLHPLDMSDAVCRPDYCRAVEGNVLIYRDSHHFTATYMRTMTAELGRQIGAATRWW
jgi:peptidoglycan/LPS O-acetylase OafA/YrhL